MRGANLSCANLGGASLRGATLRGATLRKVNLMGADLMGASLRRATLWGATLQRANLDEANLDEANLRGANLEKVNLKGANLQGTNLEKAQLPHFQVCPEIGGFYAWKKTTKGVIKIYIPTNAKRTSSLIGRKCRASHVKVISGDGVGGYSVTAPHGKAAIYEKGATIYADAFNDDIRIECTYGIHFFMTKKEAEQW